MLFPYAVLLAHSDAWEVVSRHATQASANASRRGAFHAVVRTPYGVGTMIARSTVEQLLREIGDQNGAPV